ncbi:MAG: hypothetical protein HOF33_14535 [Rhodospirillaceae bacterium]|jgi:hypothetical protein|nr:hypothetical protein [Rhodospirillaceae bacterium]
MLDIAADIACGKLCLPSGKGQYSVKLNRAAAKRRKWRGVMAGLCYDRRRMQIEAFRRHKKTPITEQYQFSDYCLITISYGFYPGIKPVP